MPHQSLEEFIRAADAAGEARFIEGADWDLEVGCLTELCGEAEGPLLVFDGFAASRTAVEVVRDTWTAELDPRLAPAKRAAGDLTVGRLLIDACRPFAWRDQYPRPNVFSAAMRRQVAAKYHDLLEGLGRGRLPATAARLGG